MSLHLEGIHHVGRCDRCDFATPRMRALDHDVASAVMRFAGWWLERGIVLCPRCRTLPAGSAGAPRLRSASSSHRA